MGEVEGDQSSQSARAAVAEVAKVGCNEKGFGEVYFQHLTRLSQELDLTSCSCPKIYNYPNVGPANSYDDSIARLLVELLRKQLPFSDSFTVSKSSQKSLFSSERPDTVRSNSSTTSSVRTHSS